jgi:hypothetical protein
MRITFARACRLAAPLAAALLGPALWAVPVEAETLAVEKTHLKLGFIKLTDMAPLGPRCANSRRRQPLRSRT